MKMLAWTFLALAGGIALAGCQSAETPPPTELSATTTAELAVTTSTTLPGTVAAAVATPVAVFTSNRSLTPTPTATPGTPTPTPTPAPSAALLREVDALQSLVGDFRDAVNSADKDALLKIQRALLAELPKADAAAANDPSKGAETFRSGLRDLRSALNGDLAKLDSAAKSIAALGGGTLSSQQRITTLAATSVQAISSVLRFAQDLANQVVAFQKAQADGNVSDLLRVQKTLLDQLDLGNVALKNAKGKDAETVRGALEDLHNALGGDGVKFDSALAKLQQVAHPSVPDASKKTTTAKEVDLQPVANELNNKLDMLQQAIDKGNEDEIGSARKALADQVKKAEDALKSNTTNGAAQLRDALGAAREAAAGDESKVDVARSQIASFMAGR